MKFTFILIIWPQLWVLLLVASNILSILLIIYLVTQKNSRKAQNQKPGIERLQNEQLKAQLEMEQIINFFSSSLVSMNTREEVIWDVAKNLIYKLGFANCMIYLWNEDKPNYCKRPVMAPMGRLKISSKINSAWNCGRE